MAVHGCVVEVHNVAEGKIDDVEDAEISLDCTAETTVDWDSEEEQEDDEGPSWCPIPPSSDEGPEEKGEANAQEQANQAMIAAGTGEPSWRFEEEQDISDRVCMGDSDDLEQQAHWQHQQDPERRKLGAVVEEGLTKAARASRSPSTSEVSAGGAGLGLFSSCCACYS